MITIEDLKALIADQAIMVFVANKTAARLAEENAQLQKRIDALIAAKAKEEKDNGN